MMKKLTVTFVILILLVMSTPVGAEVLRQVTVTPSPTFIPPSVTPTSIAFACPVGTPLGYGTYTPSPLWNATCGACASLPTSTVVPTLTIPPLTLTSAWLTATSTPTRTPTSIPPTITPTPSGGSFQVSECRLGSFLTSPTGSLVSNPAIGVTTYTATCSGTASATNSSTSGGGNLNIKFQTDRGIIGGNTTWYYDIVGTYTGSGYECVADGTVGACSGSITVSSGHDPVFVYRARDDGPYVGTISANVFMTVSTSPINATPAPTATPTTIPYIPTYCSSVTPTYDDFGFDLFIEDGDPFCEMGWDEWEITDDVYLPAVQICLQPVLFGVVRLFAIDFEMGTYGLVAAAAYFLRWLRTV